MTAIGCDQGIVGLTADVVEFLNAWPLQVIAVDDPDLIGIEQAVGKAAIGQIDQTHHTRELATAIACGQIEF